MFQVTVHENGTCNDETLPAAQASWEDELATQLTRPQQDKLFDLLGEGHKNVIKLADYLNYAGLAFGSEDADKSWRGLMGTCDELSDIRGDLNRAQGIW